jgi:hypothetical protein
MATDSESTPPDPEVLRRFLDPPKGPAVEDYDKVVARVLLIFQWLEEGMKQYLLRTELIIEGKVKAAFMYSPSIEQIWNLPLGKLLVLFEKRCGNSDLVQKIKAVVKPRNDVAHRSFLLRFDEKSRLVEREVLLRELLDLEKEILALPGDVAMETQEIMKACSEIFPKE